MSRSSSDDDSPPTTALVKVGETAPVPPLVLARSLEAASPRTFVHVDRHGQVRSPARFHAIQAGSYALLGGLGIGSTVIYGVMFGLGGALVGLGLTAMLGWSVLRVRRLQKAARLIAVDRIEEAEVVLTALLASRRVPRRTRALAEQNLAACHMRRGRFEDALSHQRAAMALHGRGRTPFATMVEHAELVTLVNLGRVAEARELLASRHATVPAGDYLRIQHWVAELYVAFADGEHRLDADELYTRARVALGITGAAALLALTAWAHQRSGDLDQAWHLLREAIERRTDVPIEATMPRLHAWMEAHRGAAEAAAPVDPLDLL